MTFQLYQPQAARPTLKLAEILAPLTYALDLTEGQPKGHCVRACWIGTRLGQEMGLSDADLGDLYYTLLLKDLGCSSNAARVCALYLADDISFKRDFKTIDDSLSAALRFVFAKTGLESGLAERFRAIVNILQNGGDIARELIETRCHQGAEIAAKLRFSTVVQDGIRNLDEHWDGRGKPDGKKGDDIPLFANIALLAQVADIFHTEVGREAAIAEVLGRAGTWFDPQLCAHFVDLAKDPNLWRVLESGDVADSIFGLPPGQRSLPVDDGYLDDIAVAFSDVVDAKSSFTADHSNRVALYADMIAEELGLTADHRVWLRRGALLHDLGKLGVSNAILDKPGRPTADEWASIRAHPVNGFDILDGISALKDLAPLARWHHERLDKGGYPDGIGASELSIEVRILSVADVFDALAAKRPYRDAMPITDVFRILDADRGTAFDPLCVDAMRAAFSRLQDSPEFDLAAAG